MPIPHDFDDPELLELALTHASHDGTANNERLEFLGDAVLDLVVAERLFRDREDLPEGSLTELKAAVVSRRALARAARALALDEQALLGPGLRERTPTASVLANLYEAVVGAVYLDAGYAAARRFCSRTLADSLAATAERERAANPKQLLQEYAQAEWGEPPSYEVLQERGRAHSRAFLIAARAPRRSGSRERFPPAWGRTRKEAERWAAYEALLALESTVGAEIDRAAIESARLH